MGSIISQFITEWGTFGAVLFAIGWMVYDNWKASKERKNDDSFVQASIDKLGGKMDNLQDKIGLVNNKVDEFKSQVDDRINIMEEKIDRMPSDNIEKINDLNEQHRETHLKQLDDLVRLGPKLHRIIQESNIKIGSDHIFVGSFHNGNSSLSGIPYYKFDIIAERFSPVKVARDCEFAHMYKDADILRFDTLPILLVQQGQVYFNVPGEGKIDMMNYDDIIWRRMRGRGIRQIALNILRDSKNTPSGFVGVVKYDDEVMNLKYLEECAEELEEIYHASELKEKK